MQVSTDPAPVAVSPRGAGRRQRLALALALTVCLAGTASAQVGAPADASPPPPAVSDTVQPGVVPDVPAGREAAGSGVGPAGDVAAEAVGEDVTEAGAGDGTAAEAAGARAPASPAPSLLEDPAGALSHLLAAPERRADLPHDLSPWGMFIAADWVVKAVMIGLVVASMATWTVWLAKTLQIAGARARVRRSLEVILSSRSLEEAGTALASRRGPAARMVQLARDELRLSSGVLGHAGGTGMKERVSSALWRIEAGAGRRLTRGTGLLATIGSTAPFVGLFGTVWGIMNSFIGISEAQTTNLAIVAPGIAEALLATAIGLVAAIPAVVIYNMFARSISGYRQLLVDALAGVERLVSRDIDFREMPAVPAATVPVLPEAR